MKKISISAITLKYALVFLCIIIGVSCLVLGPELFKLSGLVNLGPCLAGLFTVLGALIWDSIDD